MNTKMRNETRSKAVRNSTGVLLLLPLIACFAEDAKLQETEATNQLQAYATFMVKPGEKETRFEQVVGIMLNDAFHCTGTLVAKKTVLTAAHCVYDEAPGDLEVRVGASVWNAASRNRYDVTRFVVYSGNTEREQYDPHVDAHDIALVFLSRELQRSNSSDPLEPLSIHTGEPSLYDLENQRKELKFVGYGWAPGPISNGERRSVDMTPVDVQALSFQNDVATSGTCSGDSGGPAMLVRPSDRETVVVGVISSGLIEVNNDQFCGRTGTNTRVDVYHEWIEQQIANRGGI